MCPARCGVETQQREDPPSRSCSRPSSAPVAAGSRGQGRERAAACRPPCLRARAGVARMTLLGCRKTSWYVLYPSLPFRFGVGRGGCGHSQGNKY